MSDPSSNPTPKRKRGEELVLAPLKFSFDLSRTLSPEDGSSSPSSKVTHKFCGLALEGGVAAAEHHNDDAESLAKRQKQDTVMEDVLEVPRSVPEDAPAGIPITAPTGPNFFAPGPQTAPVGPHLFSAGPQISQQPPGPPSSRSSPKPRSRKRSGTPPLKFKRNPVPTETQYDADEDGDDEMEIFDPVRAALTWHEDEITVYDPDDEDDDGHGINGIGFKPTPALAHARTMKRRQQLAEYRKREESDARAKRSQRRRGGPSITFGSGEKSPSRRVRFTEAEHQNIAITTG
jgi:hypothetical protein